MKKLQKSKCKITWDPKTCARLRYSWKCLAINIGDSIKMVIVHTRFERARVRHVHTLRTVFNDSSSFRDTKSQTRRAIGPGRRGYRNPIIDRSVTMKTKSTARNISWKRVLQLISWARNHTCTRFIPTRAIRRCKFLEYTMLVLIHGEAFPRTDVARPVYETVL